MAPEPDLVDPHGRRISYLRLSVTDRCNYRCVYCMAEDMQFMPGSEVLDVDELALVGRAFVHLGVTKIRLTGGEPLVRPDLVRLVNLLRALPGLGELTLTTNGALLARLAEPLREAGLDRINISLDSLRPERFKQLTRTGRLQDVLDGIQAAQKSGFDRIKLNSVILRGRNDDEVLDLVDFARAEGLDISFIEEMPLGVIDEHDRAQTFVPSSEILRRIDQRHPLQSTSEKSGGPARYHRMRDSRTRIGVISPHSNQFCGDCNRVRVTANGQLMPCLGHAGGTDLRSILRSHPGEIEPLLERIASGVRNKPAQHHFRLDSPPQVVRFMSVTGG